MITTEKGRSVFSEVTVYINHTPEWAPCPGAAGRMEQILCSWSARNRPSAFHSTFLFYSFCILIVFFCPFVCFKFFFFLKREREGRIKREGKAEYHVVCISKSSSTEGLDVQIPLEKTLLSCHCITCDKYLPFVPLS